MGPRYPNGRRAEPTPDHLPKETKNVPTQRAPKSPPRLQLDHVFASQGFHETVRTRALNREDEWGPKRPLPAADQCGAVGGEPPVGNAGSRRRHLRVPAGAATLAELKLARELGFSASASRPRLNRCPKPVRISFGVSGASAESLGIGFHAFELGSGAYCGDNRCVRSSSTRRSMSSECPVTWKM